MKKSLVVFMSFFNIAYSMEQGSWADLRHLEARAGGWSVPAANFQSVYKVIKAASLPFNYEQSGSWISFPKKISPDGTKIIACYYGKKIVIFDRATGASLKEITLDQEINTLKLVNNSIAVGLEDNTVQLFSLDTYLKERIIKIHRPFHSFALASDLSKLVVEERDSQGERLDQITIFNLNDGSIQEFKTEFTKQLRDIFFIPDSDKIITTTGITYYIWDCVTGELVATGSGKISERSLLNDGKILVIAHDRSYTHGTPARLVFWDTSSWKELQAIQMECKLPYMITANRRFLVMPKKRGFELWDLKIGEKIFGFNGADSTPDDIHVTDQEIIAASLKTITTVPLIENHEHYWLSGINSRNKLDLAKKDYLKHYLAASPLIQTIVRPYVILPGEDIK